MGKILFTFSLLLFCICHINRGDAAVEYIYVSCVPEYGNYVEGSVYQENLNTLLLNLSSQAFTRPLFYNSTAGDGLSRIYGLYQCGGDFSPVVCNECIQAATKQIVQGCPLYNEAAVWYYECMLRYSNCSIFSLSETYPGIYVWSKLNVSINYNELAPVLASTLNSVIDETAVMSPMGHFATKDNKLSVFDNVYCLGQCTADLNEFDCRSCLTTAKSIMVSFFNTSQWVAIIQASCQLRYDTTHQFYHGMSPDAPAPAP